VSTWIGRAVLAASAAGYPLTQAVIRRFGRRGAVAVEVVSAGLLARDLALIRSGAAGRLRRLPALLLWLETIAAAAATCTGLPAALSDRSRQQTSPRRREGSEPIGRAALGTLFALHTIRFWIYLQPDRGRR
jgi:hypothetical protein